MFKTHKQYRFHNGYLQNCLYAKDSISAYQLIEEFETFYLTCAFQKTKNISIDIHTLSFMKEPMSYNGYFN